MDVLNVGFKPVDLRITDRHSRLYKLKLIIVGQRVQVQRFFSNEWVYYLVFAVIYLLSWSQSVIINGPDRTAFYINAS